MTKPPRTNIVIQGDCVEVMKTLEAESVDLVVTSPPYDNLREYGGYSFDFEATAKELHRLLKPGGVIVWVVGDATINGSETGTSFRQALYFKECGFWLYDTMIWQKTGMLPTESRYYNQFEYMFVLSKGKPKSLNFICDHKTVNGGRRQRKDSVINKGNNVKGDGYFIRNEFARRSNVWKINIGANERNHPAIFPLQLARDHITTWSNEGDLVLDPFLGSGTTAKAAKDLNRNYVGIEINPDYCKIAEERLRQEVLL